MIAARGAHQFLDTQGRHIKCVANFSEYYSTNALVDRQNTREMNLKWMS